MFWRLLGDRRNPILVTRRPLLMNRTLSRIALGVVGVVALFAVACGGGGGGGSNITGADFIEDGDTDNTSDVELVLNNGRYYVSDCDSLTGIADEGKRAGATPTPTRGSGATPTATSANRTPTPAATTRAGASANNFSNA